MDSELERMTDEIDFHLANTVDSGFKKTKKDHQAWRLMIIVFMVINMIILFCFVYYSINM